MDSFLMIGQSNMAGRGRLEDVSPIENNNLFMLRNGRWQPMHEPVNFDRPYSGVGPAVSFADAYEKYYGRAAGLIPCADGGTSLKDWEIGGQLYRNAVCQTRLAQSVSAVRGILWHQGESDSREMADAESYSARFTEMITQLRKDCGLEDVPLIMGELGGFLAEDPRKRHPYFLTVNRGIHQAAGLLPHCAVAGAEGLESNGDFLHFHAMSQREFGVRYFEVYKALMAREDFKQE